MQQKPETVSIIVCACLCLHNLMRVRYPGLQNADLDRELNDHNVIPGAWRGNDVLQDVQFSQGGNTATREAKQMRVYLKQYYNQVGAVPWQNQMI